MTIRKHENDYVNYGIVPGPVYNNFGVCDESCYVCSFETTGRHETYIKDLYLIEYNGHTSVFIRDGESWEGDYGSMPLECLFSSVSPQFKQALQIMLSKGLFSWTPRKASES